MSLNPSATFRVSGNPLITHTLTCDPAVIVHEGQLWLYTGHDEAPPGVAEYVMRHWLCFSTRDLVTWEEFPIPLRSSDFAWAPDRAYGSHVAHRDGSFYWYVALQERASGRRAIGVAVADSPHGPFRDARGSALVSHELSIPDGVDDIIDPVAFLDADGQAWLFWGKTRCYFVKLQDRRSRSFCRTFRKARTYTSAMAGTTSPTDTCRRRKWLMR